MRRPPAHVRSTWPILFRYDRVKITLLRWMVLAPTLLLLGALWQGLLGGEAWIGAVVTAVVTVLAAVIPVRHSETRVRRWLIERHGLLDETLLQPANEAALDGPMRDKLVAVARTHPVRPQRYLPHPAAIAGATLAPWLTATALWVLPFSPTIENGPRSGDAGPDAPTSTTASPDDDSGQPGPPSTEDRLDAESGEASTPGTDDISQDDAPMTEADQAADQADDGAPNDPDRMTGERPLGDDSASSNPDAPTTATDRPDDPQTGQPGLSADAPPDAAVEEDRESAVSPEPSREPADTTQSPNPDPATTETDARTPASPTTDAGEPSGAPDVQGDGDSTSETAVASDDSNGGTPPDDREGPTPDTAATPGDATGQGQVEDSGRPPTGEGVTQDGLNGEVQAGEGERPVPDASGTADASNDSAQPGEGARRASDAVGPEDASREAPQATDGPQTSAGGNAENTETNRRDAVVQQDPDLDPPNDQTQVKEADGATTRVREPAERPSGNEAQPPARTTDDLPASVQNRPPPNNTVDQTTTDPVVPGTSDGNAQADSGPTTVPTPPANDPPVLPQDRDAVERYFTNDATP